MEIAIFAEGSDSTDIRTKQSYFRSLWTNLASHYGCSNPPRVVGFSKGHLVAMYPQGLDREVIQLSDDPEDVVEHTLPPRLHSGSKKEQLDVRIARSHEEKSFDRLILAFDVIPGHDALEELCRRAEVFLTLQNLAFSPHLPPKFSEAALELLFRYRARQQRNIRGPLEVIAMQHVFEDIFLADERDLRAALRVEATERMWPSFRRTTRNADQHIFKQACKTAGADVHRVLQDKACMDKHRWADYILRHISDDSKIWAHPTLLRLRDVLT